MTAEKAWKLLEARGVKAEMASVSDYACSDGCGEGPRFILRVQGKIGVCYNLTELEATLAKSKARGKTLLKALV